MATDHIKSKKLRKAQKCNTARKSQTPKKPAGLMYNINQHRRLEVGMKHEGTLWSYYGVTG